MEDLKKLAIFTKNTQWESRAFAIWYNASQGISDGTLMIGETGVRPRGSCDEGILHTRWGNNGNYFGVSQWLVAWPCAFRLEVLRKLDNWNWLNWGRTGGLDYDTIYEKRTGYIIFFW